MMTTLKTYFLNLNFFQSSDPNNQQDEYKHRSNIIATRLHIIIFGISLFTLILALWLTPQTNKIILQYPTQEQFQTLPSDAQCPCSEISLSYGEFVSIQANFHQVCSSDFVSDRWIQSIFYGSNTTYFSRADFRVIGSAQFRALASLCDLTKTSIFRSMASFNMMLMISPYVLSRSVVESQAQTSIEQFQLTTANTFQQQLDFIRNMTIGNQLLSALETNIVPIYGEGITVLLPIAHYTIYNISNDSYCDCQINVNCRVPSGIFTESDEGFLGVALGYDISMLMEIDGFSAGCMLMDSILQSSLQCFYNQTCLNQLLSYLLTNETFTALNISNNSRFKLTSTVKEIVNELMVDEWVTNISYEKYYNQCTPIVCTYSKVERHDPTYVLTEAIAFIGGLTLVLRFIVPIVIGYIRRKKDNVPVPQISILARIHQLQISIKRFLIQLNIFYHSSSTHQQVHYQCIATRLYILILLISFTVLTSYILATKEIYQETISNPTEDQFNKLQQIYSSSLLCPCSNISVPYQAFIEIEPSYHQVCSSDMVSQSWIDYYNNFPVFLTTSSLDFRANAGHQFQILATLCEQAQQTVNDSLQVFVQQQFVSSQIISQQLFESQINESIEQWKSTTLNSFLRPIQLIRVTNQGNQLINAFHNFYLSWNQTSGQVISIPANYSNCSCARSSTCTTDMGIFNYDWTNLDYVELFRIPNFFTGCFPVESLLESTLECFYDTECMDTIESFTDNTTLKFSPLDTTLNIPNETVQSIIDRLMIDSWQTNISFSAYYNMCVPLSCSFEYMRQNDISYLISSILGIFAGLIFGIKIIILIFLRFMEKIVEDFSLSSLKRRLKSIFICRNEQQITDRCHFILLLLTLSVLYLVSLLTLTTQTEQIMKPSLATYQNLVNTYQNSLQCPCSYISIEYQSFLTIVPHVHQICSSIFVSDDWINYIYNTFNPLQLNYTDFRTTAIGQYELLVSFCQLSQQVVEDSLSNLATSSFIDSQLLSSNLLSERIQTLVQGFQTTIPSSFLDSLSIIRQTTGANMHMNMFMTNSKFEYESLYGALFLFYTIPLEYQGCNCGISSTCVQSSQGMMAGCYPLEALLQSTLQCFYNQTCIDPTNTFQALNSSSNVSSQFSINSTLESILNNLMVENYSINISYENYFSQCKPLSCSYSYIAHNDLLEVTLTVIGLYGGLAVIARFIVVLIFKLYRCRNQKISPETSQESNREPKQLFCDS